MAKDNLVTLSTKVIVVMAKHKSNIIRYKTKIHVIILPEMKLLSFWNDWKPKRTVSIKHIVLKIFQKFLLKVLYHLKFESLKPLTYSSYNRNNKVYTQLVYKYTVIKVAIFHFSFQIFKIKLLLWQARTT